MAEKSPKTSSESPWKTGYQAITSDQNSNQPTPPYAIPRVQRDENGLLRTIYIDPQTGEQVSNLNGYTVIDGNNYYKPDEEDDLDENGVVEPEEVETNTEKALDKNKGGALESDRSPKGFSSSNSASNNFGYKSKPGFVSLASALPGTLGLAGKAVNLGWNGMNMSAVSQARSMLGLPDMTGKQTARSLMSDQKGQVASIGINGQKYSVGFEAMSPDKRTNLTPTEANNRANLLGGLTEDKAGTKKSENKGLVSRMLDKLSGIEDKTVTPSTPATTTATTETPGTKNAPTERVRATSQETPSGIGTGYSQFQGTDPETVGLSSDLDGKGRPNMPDRSLTDAVRSAVANTFGPGYSVNVTSGTEDKGNQVGSTRHKTGLAADFDVRDPQGNKVTDTNKINDMVSGFAFDNPTAGIGFGTGYMTDEAGKPGRVHLDVTGQAKQWGALGKNANMATALSETIDAARAGYQPTPFSNVPTPTARPDNITRSPLDPVGDTLDPIGVSSIQNPNQDTVARQTVSNALNTPAPAQFDKSMPPAQAASLGFVTRTPEQIGSIARAIAGELSPSALKALSVGDPDAKAELASMVATMENRATSKMFSSLESALNPTQYNSLMDSQTAVTQANYDKFSAALNENVNAFYAGQLAPENWGVTSYYNPDIADPDWGSLMSNPTQIGAHVFGSLPEYGPNQSYTDSLNDRVNKDNLGRPSGTRSAQTGLGTGRASNNTYGGAGFTPGGMDSPSGSTYGGIGGANFGGNTSGGSSFGNGGIGSDRGSTSRAGAGTTGIGGGGIGSDRGSVGRAGPGNAPSGQGGIGSDHSADRSRDNDKGGGFGSGGIGHA